jgi:hypothetical protein
MVGLTTDYSSVWTAVNAEKRLLLSATPIASTLAEATSYLTASKTTPVDDPAKACRQKFAIIITDGADTISCSGTGVESQTDQYKRRKISAAKAKALADAGYKLFVVGFGADMSAELQNTLNWMAYYGGTSNPGATQSGNTSAITPSASPCTEGSSNDPGSATLSGYAFLASTPADLTTALVQSVNTIRQAVYSFSATSVSASRTSSENHLYEASFQPRSDPFWDGYLKKYNINSDGSVGSMVWDAGATLSGRNLSTSPRNVFTYRGGSFQDFGMDSPPGHLKTSLGVQTGAQATSIASYILGLSTPDDWRLGDPSTPTQYLSGALPLITAMPFLRRPLWTFGAIERAAKDSW